jgi:FkbM family methyltransferase
MRARLIQSFLSLYERASKTRLLDNALGRRAFESAYLGYKLLIEAGPVAQLQSVVAPGSTVIDVGANIGFFALRFGRWVGPEGRVIAIEPERRNMAALRRRVQAARLNGVVECVQAAAADRAGEVRLAVNPAHPGDHRIAEDGERVPAVTIDDLTAGDPRKVALVKIDVQGAEMLVLAGARRVLETHHPALFVEVDDGALTRFGSSSAELIEKLATLGYTGHTLTRRGIGAAEAPDALTAGSSDTYRDVLFLPEARRASVNAEGTRAGR